MFCFRDTTYCDSPQCTGACGYQWTPELQAAAEKWWNPQNKPELVGKAPVAFSYFCGEPIEENEGNKQ